MKACISVAEAEKLTGISRHIIQRNLRSGVWKFGDIVPPKTPGGRPRYYIWVAKLEAHIGRRLTDE